MNIVRILQTTRDNFSSVNRKKVVGLR